MHRSQQAEVQVQAWPGGLAQRDQIGTGGDGVGRAGEYVS